MRQLTIRGASAELPEVPPEPELTRLNSLAGQRGLVSCFSVTPATSAVVSAFNAGNLQLLDGVVSAVRAETAAVSGVSTRSVEVTGCDLGLLRWTGGTISRTRFAGCRLLGARFESVTLDHVIFSDCQLDYAVLDQVRAKGPVLFSGCSLREAEFRGCDLTRALFDDCQLTLTEFGPGRYQGCDLRGNDLSAVLGTQRLQRVTLDQAQVLQLGVALAAELEVSFGDEHPAAGGEGAG
jgi:uncharacterized protein YjbI with pentapeptide repeats